MAVGCVLASLIVVKAMAMPIAIVAMLVVEALATAELAIVPMVVFALTASVAAVIGWRVFDSVAEDGTPSHAALDRARDSTARIGHHARMLSLPSRTASVCRRLH